ncbi:YciI family protein [Actinokineospora sp. NBRC 105648]|uniref:YciI family protein n=1 Tax=Actinokineospora sp. NBRC 105648 TaxID=3032206 RepID=UPI0024A1B3B5|nr:YciI family protein [Actinokineospora sp. NBRC 105648]GLZ38287.1 hypothetical protein Acsp05_19110 [Actinokineospora sp. NBRC 105648]
MRYVVLIYANPASRDVWATLSAERKQAGLAAYAELNAELAASGELVASEALAEGGTRLPGQFATDGPFAEAKEHLAGFYLLECADFDRAVAIAGRIPEASLGLVEVRSVRGLQDFL